MNQPDSEFFYTKNDYRELKQKNHMSQQIKLMNQVTRL